MAEFLPTKKVHIVKIDSFRVRNFRAFVDTGQVRLRPLTIVLGENSIGKSSLVRILPLMRQSAETKTRKPIRWWGSQVDFGSFGETLRTNAEAGEIRLEFTIIEEGFVRRGDMPFPHPAVKYPSPIGVELVLTRSSQEPEQPAADEYYVSAFEVAVCGSTLRLHLDENAMVVEVIVAGKTLPAQKLGQVVAKWEGGFLPDSLETVGQEDISNSVTPGRPIYFVGQRPRRPQPIASMFSDYAVESLLGILHKNTGKKTAQLIYRQAEFCTSFEMFAGRVLSESRALASVAVLKNLNSSDEEDQARIDIFRTAYQMGIAKGVAANLWVYGQVLETAFSNVSYVAPLRAQAQRYYRDQDQQVAEVDPTGFNLPVFLRSLSAPANSRFQEWCYEKLRFRPSTQIVGGHLQLKYVASVFDKHADDGNESAAASRNIADMGFGYSQMLPLLAQLWHATERSPDEVLGVVGRPRGRIATVARTIVIEQPELHLHPRLQSRLGMILAETASSEKEGDETINIIVETHSEHLVNSVARMVARGDLAPDSVVIYVLEEDRSNGSPSIREVLPDEHGTFRNWPVGFFSPDIDGWG